MDFRSALRKLEESSDFKKWRQKNKSTYFSYAFKIPQEMPSEWQIGFYDQRKDKITTFTIVGDSIGIKPEEEIFKREGTKVNEIQLNKVKLAFDNAIEKADEFQQKNFPKDKSIKTIAILQNIPNFGTVWNVTYITEAFNTLNMKIDAENGNILKHNLSSLLSFRKE